MTDDKEYKVIGKGPEGSEASGKDRELGYATVTVKKLTKPDKMAKQAAQEKIQVHCAAIPEPDVQVKIELGEPTTSFSHDVKAIADGTKAIVQGTTGIISEGVNMTGAAVNSVVNNTGMILELTNTVISESTEFVTAKTAEIAKTLATWLVKWPVETLSYCTSYVTEFLPEAIKEVTSEVMKQADWMNYQDVMQKTKEAALKKAQEEARLNVQFKGVEKIQKCLGKVKSKMEKITDHINEGGTFVQGKTIEVVNNTFDEITSVTDKVIEQISTLAATSAREAGEKLAHKRIEKQKKKLKKQLQKSLKKVEELKKKAEIEVNKAKVIAILKICALIGM